MHLGPFGCLTKLGAKRAELVQKFEPLSRVRIFRNECTRSTPLDPKLMFYCVSYHLGAFGTIWLPYETRCKTGQTSAEVRAICEHLVTFGAKRVELVQNFVPRSRIVIFHNKYTRSSPLDPKLMFWCNSYHLGAFGTVRLPYKTGGKTGRTSAKVRTTKSSRIFFVMNASNPPHWNLNSCFGAFRTVLVHLRPFGCLVKLGAKCSKLVQKF